MMKFKYLIIQEKFKYAITCSAAYKKEKKSIENLCTIVLDDLYNLNDRRKQLGLDEQVKAMKLNSKKMIVLGVNELFLQNIRTNFSKFYSLLSQ